MRWFLLVCCGFGFPSLIHAAPPAKVLAQLHAREAESIQLFTDEAHTQPLELRKQPIFSWTNILRDEGQCGQLYAWMRDGRPEAVGTMFSGLATWVTPPRRAVVHEFHSLSSKKLWPVKPDKSQFAWQPQAGLTMKAVPKAPPVAATPAGRLVQMREIARTFTGETHGMDQQRWELRLLPQPALRYQPTRTDILDGALFLFVSTAGTDPEVILPVEAQKDQQGAWVWYYGIARFTDRDLVVRHNDAVVWSSLSDPNHKAIFEHDYSLIRSADHAYTCYRARYIDELPNDAVTE